MIANLLESYLQGGVDVDGKLDETAANLILDMKPSKVVSNELTVSWSPVKVLFKVYIGRLNSHECVCNVIVSSICI